MGVTFWTRRFIIVAIGAFAIICAAQMLKGHDVSYAAVQGGIWGIASATAFVAGRIIQSRRGQHCAICKDTPEVPSERRTS